MPGSLYILVAAMTGSIVSRNRNILLRATVPMVVGIGAGWVVLPNTMRNVSDLLWTYEQRFPAIADGHIRTREGVEKAWRMPCAPGRTSWNCLRESLLTLISRKLVAVCSTIDRGMIGCHAERGLRRSTFTDSISLRNGGLTQFFVRLWRLAF